MFIPLLNVALHTVADKPKPRCDYLRHSNLHVTNKYLQATSKTKRLAHDKLVDAFLPAGLLPKPNLVQ
jgi:hypothetical protein